MNLKVRSYSVEKISPSRRPAIWLHVEPNILFPVCYLQRPKHISDGQWRRVLKAIRIEAEPGILECDE
jgi:ABC-type glutathione transport system ATPase component